MTLSQALTPSAAATAFLVDVALLTAGLAAACLLHRSAPSPPMAAGFATLTAVAIVGLVGVRRRAPWLPRLLKPLLLLALLATTLGLLMLLTPMGFNHDGPPLSPLETQLAYATMAALILNIPALLLLARRAKP